MTDRPAYAVPAPAATVVILRPGADGPEVLLTHRPATMAFGPDLHVFPGGRIEPGDVDAAAAAARESREEVGVELEPIALVPLSRWVTPRSVERRFDVRFFMAAVPAGTAAGTSREVVAAEWLRPRDALAAMVAGSISLWQPTSVTLQQLAWLDDLSAIASLRAADDHAPPTVVYDPMRIRGQGQGQPLPVIGVEFANAGGVPGRTATTWLVGEREFVVVDPADPVPETAATLERLAAERGGRIVGIALTHLDPEHHSGVEVFATDLGVPVVIGEGSNREAPYETSELPDGAQVPFGDVALRALGLPGPRPEHLGYEICGTGAFFCGDLLDGHPGPRPARGALPPPDRDAWARSLARLDAAASSLLLPSHGGAVTPRAGRPPAARPPAVWRASRRPRGVPP